MITTELEVKTSRGDADVVGLISSAIRVAQPTVGDLLYAGQRQRTRILDRTSRGLDVNEVAFKPYSEKGPYYYYPSHNAKNRRAGVLRQANKLGVRAKGGPNRRGEQVTRLGIKFPSYGAFKRALGRAFVDLRGPSAPHMLQAILVKVGGVILPGVTEFAGGLSKEALDQAGGGDLTPATEIVIGIYGPEGARASGHNTGAKYLPKRKFMGSSQTDQTSILSDILKRSAFRVNQILKGGSS